ncbi:hypothetical protein ACN38_g5019 [Penicillium nordicum]|uniref:Trichodiene oxygenase n=1 Tax=Penicillium nordicum TaxID=229535 RepID=A0A0M8PB19_9EURO|nr:hypothetical protein ACN38_g5019 [Penicillium nordicum]
MLFKDCSVSAAIGAAFSGLAAYFVTRCIYDLFFHPLRKFPGPKLAAIGSFYEFYYDVIKDGTYLWEIEKMHKEYGPIIRINSKSLHMHDPNHYATIYAGGGRKVNKEASAVSGYTFPHSTVATLGHDLHHKRRAIMNPYFSKRAIMDVEPFINERIDALCSRLAKTISQEATIDLTSVFAAFSADVVMYHFYGSHSDFLGSRDLCYGLRDAMTAILDFYNIARFLPISPATVKKFPLWILGFLNRNFPPVITARDDNRKMILEYLNNMGREKTAKAETKFKPVIVSALTDSSVPAEEKRLDRLLDEGETIIFAGIDTTARALGVAMFHLLNEKKLLLRLRQELDSLTKLDGHWTTADLAGLPYMRGVVQEAIRLSYGIVTRLPRISAHEPLQYKGFTIPPGTPVSQSSYLINNDASVFPNSHIFDPERWIKAAQGGINLDKFMVSFSKGSRVCIAWHMHYSISALQNWQHTWTWNSGARHGKT